MVSDMSQDESNGNDDVDIMSDASDEELEKLQRTLDQADQEQIDAEEPDI